VSLYVNIWNLDNLFKSKNIPSLLNTKALLLEGFWEINLNKIIRSKLLLLVPLTCIYWFIQNNEQDVEVKKWTPLYSQWILVETDSIQSWVSTLGNRLRDTLAGYLETDTNSNKIILDVDY